MKVAIHQPNFLPWLGYFVKIAKADIFVFLDDVEYTKAGYTRRTLISGHNGDNEWLNVPLQKHSDNSTINTLRIDHSKDWPTKQQRLLFERYHKLPFYNECIGSLSQIYQRSSDFEYLSDWNIALIDTIKRQLNIPTKMLKSSELEINYSNDVNIDICNHLKASVYISGKGGQNYQSELEYAQNDIDVCICDAMTYLQSNEIINGFDKQIIGRSIIDIWCDLGMKQLTNALVNEVKS